MGSSEINFANAGHVSTANARAYAVSRGWRRRERDVGRLAVFEHPDHELAQVLIPLDPDRADFFERMSDALGRLAEIERRSLEAIVRDVSAVDSDTLRFRVASSATDLGTLPLPAAIQLLDGARQSLLSAAHSVLSPARFHPRLARSEAEALLRACHLGQTERGSFAVTISCPLSAVAPDSGLIDAEDGTFARRSTRLLAETMLAIEAAIERDCTDTLLQDAETIRGLSGNLCDALLKMRPEGDDATLSFEASWATSRPVHQPERHGNKWSCKFSSEHFHKIEELYERLKPQHQQLNEHFVGLVDQLRGTMVADVGRSGEVVLTLLDPATDEVIKARADLGAEEYRLADQLHMTGNPVLVVGKLVRGRRVSRLSSIRIFKPLERQVSEQPRDA